jgi:hypothetical protein
MPIYTTEEGPVLVQPQHNEYTCGPDNIPTSPISCFKSILVLIWPNPNAPATHFAFHFPSAREGLEVAAPRRPVVVGGEPYFPVRVPASVQPRASTRVGTGAPPFASRRALLRQVRGTELCPPAACSTKCSRRFDAAVILNWPRIAQGI